MSAYELSAEEALLVYSLRAVPPEQLATAVLLATGAMAKATQPDPEPRPEFTPPAPPAHDSWDAWTEDDFDRARIHGALDDPRQQFAFFLIGYMALQGIISQEQARDQDQTLRLCLEEALDAGAQGFNAHDYRDFRQLCDFAAWAQLTKRASKP